MKLDILYTEALKGGKSAEKELFEYLNTRFKYLVQLRIWIEADRDEIVQETLMTIAAKYKTVKIESSFAGWVYKILNNNILYYMRSKKYRQDRFVNMSDEEDGQYISDPELRIRILDCLKKICRANTRNARVLNLYYQGFSAEEICDKLNLTRNNFYSVIHRARAMLESCLEKGELQ